MPDKKPSPAATTEAEKLQAYGDSEAEILNELKKGHALRCSLDPLVNDFKSPVTAEQVYAVLCKYHAQGLVDSTYENPDKEKDGVPYRWHLNFLGLQYLEKRGQEGVTPEEAYEQVVGHPIAAASQAVPQQPAQPEEPAKVQQREPLATDHRVDMLTSKITTPEPPPRPPEPEEPGHPAE